MKSPLRTYANISAMNDFDVIVIGAGSAGRYGAKVAANEGAKAALIEAGPFGGLYILVEDMTGAV